SFWNKTNTKSIVHIDSKPAEVDFFYHPEVELVGDIKITLKKLTHLTKFNKKMPDYPNKLRKFILNQFEENRQSTDFPVKPQKLIWDLREAMAPDDILISDVGAHKVWIARMFPTKKPNTCIISNGFASMGIAVPGAIAAKLANPDVNIVAATGDGGFLMNSQELETAKRLGVHFTVVIFTDKKYGLCEWKQQDHYKKTFGVDFTNPDFVMYAESFGAKGYSVKKTEDLLPLLKKAIKAKEISIIEVPVDYRENFKLSEELGKDICNLFY
ncbi:acetolactate synthase large subunit, partial [Candidatus Woesearchaeota archaeon]|nr:acetolactate synthase large subunit [Candidatus Woesearchaeota archaeon]